MKTRLFIITIACSLSACRHIVKKADEVASSTSKEIGHQVGEKSTQFVNGVKEGIDNAYGCTLEITPSLKDMGLEAGKFVISSDTGTTTANKLSVYIIASKAIDKQVTAKVIDASGNEYGRTSAKIKMAAGEAHFFDFVFDKRTNIESRSKISFN